MIITQIWEETIELVWPEASFSRGGNRGPTKLSDRGKARSANLWATRNPFYSRN